ncbi:membrane-associated phospholipid phosphatase [Candidatus Nitrososphaera evergladensis SR1]|uniref:Membrane-associated phospholipid phosphatase n=1 Tax=Candidatus Nitrososphaera evergladensis SR1 TaxID=1459636 RepID=A0A075MSB3_9ARCH|nr:membrane-associated phospholipid phosphatase [Candidatus Nitrososphaera evergladensis SR1]
MLPRYGNGANCYNPTRSLSNIHIFLNNNDKKYLAVSMMLIASFLVLAALVSPRVNPDSSNSGIAKDDADAFLAVNDSHFSTPFDQFMILLTEYGREAVWIVAGALIFFFGGRAGRKTAVVMTMALLVLIPIGTIAKEIVARPRPIVPQSDFLLAADPDFSFPSGHALIVSAGAATVLVLYRGSGRKMLVSLGLAAEAALVCLSRVYVGGHYPLDVLGGILLGVGVAFIFVGIAGRIEVAMRPVANVLRRNKR